MENKLFPFQLEGVEFLKKHNRCFLLSEMGLGKTVQAVCAAKDLKLKHVLVVCPASLRTQWGREFIKWYPECNSLIVSYNFIQKKKNAKSLLDVAKWDLVISDECQAVSNWKSAQTQNFSSIIIENIQRVWLISGTPATKSAANWHSLLSIVQPGKWGRFNQFCERFCYEKTITVKTKWGLKKITSFHGWRQADFLRAAVESVSIRHTKASVGMQLPEKFYSKLYIEVNLCLLHNPSGPVNLITDVDDVILNGKKQTPHISKLRQQIGLSKIKNYLEIIEDVNKPLLIFAWHTEVIDTLYSELLKTSKRTAKITGETGFKERQSIVDNFESGEVDILVLSIACCGTGLNLPRAEMVDFLELPWSAALMDQASDRAVRLTSKQDKVFIRNILAAGTIDERVLRVLTEKRLGMESVVHA